MHCKGHVYFSTEVKVYSFPYSVMVCLHLVSITFKILSVKNTSLVIPKATELRENHSRAGEGRQAWNQKAACTRSFVKIMTFKRQGEIEPAWIMMINILWEMEQFTTKVKSCIVDSWKSFTEFSEVLTFLGRN